MTHKPIERETIGTLNNAASKMCAYFVSLLLTLVVGADFAEAQLAVNSGNFANIVKGACGEAVSDAIFKDEGWEKLAIKPWNTGQGLDGVYVKRTFSGAISKVMFAESKTEGSQLIWTSMGQQGSQDYIKGQLERYNREILSGLPKESPLVKEYADLQKFCSKLDKYPSTGVRTSFADGQLFVAKYPVISPQPGVAELGEPTLQKKLLR